MSAQEFVRECRRDVDRLGDGLVAAERGGDAAAVDELFRTAHSLKGRLAMEGHDDASDLAHAVEDVLDAIRGGDLDPPPPAVIDRALDAVDDLERAVGAIGDDGHGVDPDPTIRAVRRSLAEHRDGDASADDRSGDDGGPDRPAEPAGAAGPDDEDAGDGLTAEEALAAVDEFDDLEGMAAEIDDADEFAGLEGGGSFGDIGDVSDAGDHTPDPDPDPGPGPDLDPGNGVAPDAGTTGDDGDGDAEPAGSDDEGPVGGEPEFEELRSSVDEAAVDELDRELEGVEFGEFDDADSMSIGDLLAADPPDADSTAEPAEAGTTPGSADSEPDSPGAADDATIPTDPGPADGSDPTSGSGADAAGTGVGADAAGVGAESGTDSRTGSGTAAGGDGAPDGPDGPDSPDGFGSFEPAVGESGGSDGASDAETTGTDALADIDDSFGSAFDESGGEAADPAATSTAGEGGAAAGPGGGSDDGAPDDAEDDEAEALERVLAAVEDDGSDAASGSGPAADRTPEAPADDAGGVGPRADASSDDGPAAADPFEGSDIADGLAEPSLDDTDAGTEPVFERDSDTAAFEERFADAFGDGDSGPSGRPATTLGGSAFDVDPPERNGSDDGGTLRIDAADAGELLSLAETVTASARRLSGASREPGGDVGGTVREATADLEAAATALRRLAVEVRLTPIEGAFDGLRRAARDVARETGKAVELTAAGGDVTVDRRVVDAVGEPLVHLVRNAVDHGIEPPDERRDAGKPETGTVEVVARRERDRVILEVRDDGHGVDATALRRRAVEAGLLTRAAAEDIGRAEAFDLLFHPGLSTNEAVTSVSGRGVGMDVVKRTADRLDGDVEVESTPGEGTVVRLSLPATVAVTEALFVTVGDEEYALPAAAVEAVGPAGASAGRAGGLPASTDGGESTRIDLRTALGGGPTAADGSSPGGPDGPDEPDEPDEPDGPSEPGDADGVEIRVRRPDGPATLRCDGVGDRREVVVDPYDDLLAAVPGVAGATVVGGDRLVNVLDIDSL